MKGVKSTLFYYLIISTPILIIQKSLMKMIHFDLQIIYFPSRNLLVEQEHEQQTISEIHGDENCHADTYHYALVCVIENDQNHQLINE